MFKKQFTIMMLLIVGSVAWMQLAQAIPVFARKYDKPCSSCHNAWPQLNKAGRMFKEAGYKFPGESKKQEISDSLALDKAPPVTAVLASRPYDRKKSGKNAKLRALHEVEIIVAGNIAEKFSGYFEFEAEDETTFDPEVASAVFSYHVNDVVNVHAVWGPMLWADPYTSYVNHQRLTRGSVSVINQRFGNADGSTWDGTPGTSDEGKRLRDARQNFVVSGRPIDILFYSVGISADGNDPEGDNPSIFTGRLVADVMENLSVGLLHVSGECDGHAVGCGGGAPAVSSPRDFTRTGFDVQADIGDARINAVLVQATDDNWVAAGSKPAEEDNNAFYVQGMYIIKDGKRPSMVPLIRFDSYEQNDGAAEYQELTLNMTYYFSENAKGYIEHWEQIDVPTGKSEDKRTTLQFAVAF
jgi:hypothetical protein